MAVEPTSGTCLQRLHRQLTSFKQVRFEGVSIIPDDCPVIGIDEIVCIHAIVGPAVFRYAVTQRNFRQTQVFNGAVIHYYEDVIRVYRSKSPSQGWADVLLLEKPATTLDSSSFLAIMKTIAADAKALAARGD